MPGQASWRAGCPALVDTLPCMQLSARAQGAVAGCAGDIDGSAAAGRGCPPPFFGDRRLRRSCLLRGPNFY